MRAIVYRRVSTDEQVDSGHGLNAQLDACQRWCEQNEAEPVGPFDDSVTGKFGLDKRPGLIDAITELNRGDVLLVAKRDRLGRGDPLTSAMIQAAIERKGARVVSVAGEGTATDGPSDILMRRMVDAFAEYERLIISARVKAALAAKRKRLERTGKVPLGFKLLADGKTLEPVASELETVELIQRLRSEGNSLRAIAAELTARTIKTKDGGDKWSHATVQGILRRTLAA